MSEIFPISHALREIGHTIQANARDNGRMHIYAHYILEGAKTIDRLAASNDKLETQNAELQDQNDQLREYASDLWQYIYVGTPRDGQRLNDRAHELGVKVGK